jgi:hypothetical protein
MELAIVVILYCLLPKPHASYTGVNIVTLPKILSPVSSFLVKRVLIKTEHGLEIISVATTTTMPFFLPRLTGAFPSISHTHTYLVPPNLNHHHHHHFSPSTKICWISLRPTTLANVQICGLTSLDNLSFALLQGPHYALRTFSGSAIIKLFLKMSNYFGK